MTPLRVLVTGAHGFIGQAVCRKLLQSGYDVTDGGADLLFNLESRIFSIKPDAVIHLAKPRSDGIRTMAERPYGFADEVLQLDRTVIRLCALAHPKPKPICMGSACAYPEKAPIPTPESALWNGYPEKVNAPYGIAKRTQLMLLQAARVQHGLNGLHLILSNVYGPGDRTEHVIPATIRKMAANPDELTVWGRPDVTRSFLYVEDAAEGIVLALERYNAPEPLNLAPLEETSMVELVNSLSYIMDWHGTVKYDRTKPTGQRRRKYNTREAQEHLRWTARTGLEDGLTATVRWMTEEKLI